MIDKNCRKGLGGLVGDKDYINLFFPGIQDSWEMILDKHRKTFGITFQTILS